MLETACDLDLLVFDDFLTADDFDALARLMLETNTPFGWFLEQVITEEYGMDLSQDRQMSHLFYSDVLFRPTSDYWVHLLPAIRLLNPTALLRVKANLQWRAAQQIERNFHTDVPLHRCEGIKTAVLYINTNNGYTKFEDGRRVDSVSNRLAVFDACLYHTGVAATDVDCRVVVNFDFVGQFPKVKA